MQILKTTSKLTIALLSASAVVGLVLIVSVAPRPAAALPAYAASTKKPCSFCHVNPAGGGPRNATGTKFEKNGHKL